MPVRLYDLLGDAPAQDTRSVQEVTADIIAGLEKIEAAGAKA
jgi:hypothetical protein